MATVWLAGPLSAFLPRSPWPRQCQCARALASARWEKAVRRCVQTGSCTESVFLTGARACRKLEAARSAVRPGSSSSIDAYHPNIRVVLFVVVRPSLTVVAALPLAAERRDIVSDALVRM